MATITRIERKSGARFKAIIKHRGRILKTKTFQSKTKAMLWSKRIEGDQEMIEALSMRGVPPYRSIRLLKSIWHSGVDVIDLGPGK